MRMDSIEQTILYQPGKQPQKSQFQPHVLKYNSLSVNPQNRKKNAHHQRYKTSPFPGYNDIIKLICIQIDFRPTCLD